MAILETDRLWLRPFDLDDAKTVQRLAGDWEVAATVPAIPHPYLDGAAESWIQYLKEAGEKGSEIGFAIVRKDDHALLGATSLMVNKPHHKGEIGYWLGRPYWENGYATETCRKMVEFGFADLGLNRLFAPVMSQNRASARVLVKAGLKYEGTARQSLLIRDSFEDICTYALLRTDYMNAPD